MLKRLYPFVMQGVAVAAAFVVVSTYAFGRGSANAIDFAVAIGLTLAGTAALAGARSRVDQILAGAVTVAAAWTVVVNAGVFDGATQRWLTFAAAIGAAAIATLADANALRGEREAAAVVSLGESRAA